MSEPTRRELAMGGAVLHAGFRTPMPGLKVEVRVPGEPDPLVVARSGDDGTFTLHDLSGAAQRVEVRVLDPDGAELQCREVAAEELVDLELLIDPRRSSPDADDWNALRRDLAGAPLGTVGALVSELEAPTRPALADWDPDVRGAMRRETELEFLDPHGTLRDRLAPDALRLRRLQDPRALARVERAVLAGVKGQIAQRRASRAIELLRRRLHGLPALRQSAAGFATLPKIGARLRPQTLNDVAAAVGFDADARRWLRENARDLTGLMRLARAPGALDPGALAEARRLARGALSIKSVQLAERDRRSLADAVRTLELPAAADEALDRASVRSPRALLDPQATDALRREGLDRDTIGVLRRAAVFTVVTPDGATAAALSQRFASLHALANAPLDDVVDELRAAGVRTDARAVRRQAAAVTSLVADKMMTLAVDRSPANAGRVALVRAEPRTGPTDQIVAALSAGAFEEGCEPCLDCESALSPAAYLTDLLDFASDAFDRTLAELEDRFTIPFRDIVVSCDSVEAERPQIELTNEILARFIVGRRGQPWRALDDAGLDNLYDEFRALADADAVPDALDTAFVNTLREMGATAAEVAAAMAGGAAEQQEFADRLALDVAQLPHLARDPATATRGHLANLADLMFESKYERLVRSLSEAAEATAYATRLGELLAAIAEGAPDYDAQVAAAEVGARAHAAAQLADELPTIRETARGDAEVAAAEARERIAQVLLPAVRANLVVIALAAAAAAPVRNPNPTDLDGLADYLAIDLRVDTCHRTTLVALAMGALQTFVLHFLLGKESLQAVTDFDHQRWRWTRSYAIWAAVQTIFLYPENFLFPRFRFDRSESFDRMIGFVEARITTRRVAQEALDSLAEELRDFAGVTVEQSVEAGDTLYFFTIGRVTRHLYYSTLDPERRWSGWRRIEVGRGEPATAVRMPTPEILDATALGDQVFVMIRNGEHAAQLITQGPTGDFTELIDVADKVWKAKMVGIKTQFAEYVLILARMAVDKWDPDESEDVGSEAAWRAYTLEPGGQVEETNQRAWMSKTSWLIGMTFHSPTAASADVDHPHIYFSMARPDTPGGSHKIDIRAHRADNLARLHDETGAGFGIDSPTIGSRSGTIAVDWTVGPTRYRLVSLGARSVEDEEFSDRLVAGYHRSGTQSGWRFHMLDGDLNELGLATSRDGHGLAETHGQAGTFGTMVARGNEVFAVLGSHLVTVPWESGWDDPTRWGAVGQLTLAREVASATRLAFDARAVETAQDRQALIARQEAHFDHFTWAGYARRYVEELFLHAPLALGELLNQEERYEEAALFYRSVFDPYAGPAGERFVFEGFRREEPQDDGGLGFRDEADYLTNPFDPHAIAKVRPHSYARYTVLQAVDNLLDWADAEFARDTRESVDRARELYETAGEILRLDDLPPDLCASGFRDLLIEILKKRGYTKTLRWKPILDHVWAALERNGREATHREAQATLTAILQNGDSDERQRAKAVAFLDDVRARGERPSRSVGEAFAHRDAFRGNTAYALGAESWLLEAGEVLDFRKPLTEVRVAPRFFEFGFCIPPNPAGEALRFRVESNLAKIERCQNFAGVKRTLETYAAAADPTALIEAAAAGGGDIEGFIPAEPPPGYRYSFLVDRARHLSSLAQHVEAYLLSSLEKRDAADYSLLQAKNDLKLKREQVALEALRMREATNRVKQATLQRDRAQFTHDHFEGLLAAGTNTLEDLAIGMMFLSLALPSSVSVTFGMSPSVSVGYSPSGMVQTLANIFNTQASYQRRAEEWRYQRDRADYEIQIGDVGIDIANDQVEIVKQESDTAALSADLASKTVEFLGSQFTNADLYRWMVRELRKVYRRHLNLAVATAHAAESALAFELQEQLSFIGYQYFEMKREGLLGAERLTLDIERMEQHRIRRAERRQELTKTISLRSLMPVEFQRFRETGQIDIATQPEWFDRDHPGHYMRLIKSVEVTVVALVHPLDGLHATLTNHGLSRVMVGPPFVEDTILQRPPETVTLSSAESESGLFQLRLDDPMLLPFEGHGVVTTWTLDMPKASNRFDFSGIYEVLLKVRYTSRIDAGYREKLVARIEQGTRANVFFGMKNSFPDTWFHFQNPRFINNPANYGFGPGQQPPPYAIRFSLDPSYFPPNEEDVEIVRTQLLFEMDDEFRIPVDVNFRSTGGPNIPAHGLEVDGGRLSLPHFNGRSPFGEWTIRPRNEADAAAYPEWRAGSGVVEGQNQIDVTRIRNVVIVIEYSARVRYA